jgi:hypothetical protein
MSRFMTFASTAIVAGGLGLAAVATAGIAAAYTGDNTEFFSQIEQAGIGYSSPQVAVKNAQTVCQLMSNGKTPSSISSEIMSNSDLTQRQASAFVTASVESFCPTYAGAL